MAEYYATTTGAGAHDGTSESDAWSLSEACDNITAGNKVWVKADGIYETEDGSNDCVFHVTVAGTSGTITWEGYYATIGDGGIVTINADPTGDQFTNALLIAAECNAFKNFMFTGASGAGVQSNSVSNLAFKNCLFVNNGGYGVDVYISCLFENCQFENNTSDGFNIYNAFMFCCVSFDNGGRGGYLSSGTIFGLLVYNNSGSEGLKSYSAANLINCTFDGENSGTAYWLDNSNSSLRTYNSIIYDWNYGLSADGAQGELHGARCNLYYSNTYDVNSNMLPVDTDDVGGRGDVTSSPGFTDEANDDYTLDGSGSADAKGMDAKYTVDFWNSFNQGAGSNPPSP